MMGDLYASAVGTTVLINRRVPKRPPTFDGKLLLMDMKGSADETSVIDALTSYGSITSVRGLDAQHGSSSVQLGCSSVVEVTFRTQAEAADVALQAAGTLLDAAGRAICEWHTLLYNDRPYDERGWCCFEQIVANELIKLFVGVPKVDEVLKRLELPPKVLDLAREHDAYAADGSAGEGGNGEGRVGGAGCGVGGQGGGGEGGLCLRGDDGERHERHERQEAADALADVWRYSW